MELTIKKDVNPKEYHIRSLKGTEHYAVEKDGQVIALIFEAAFDDFVSIFAMAGACYSFQHKEGAFAEENETDDLNNVL